MYVCMYVCMYVYVIMYVCSLRFFCIIQPSHNGAVCSQRSEGGTGGPKITNLQVTLGLLCLTPPGPQRTYHFRVP